MPKLLFFDATKSTAGTWAGAYETNDFLSKDLPASTACPSSLAVAATTTSSSDKGSEAAPEDEPTIGAQKSAHSDGL
eukprot:427716-Heterocapsa_arctica.AAC.1